MILSCLSFHSLILPVHQIRRQVLYELNTSGKYYAFKEQLKRAIVKIVREKYLHTAPIADPVQRQAFLSNLYVFLTEQMHKTYVL